MSKWQPPIPGAEGRPYSEALHGSEFDTKPMYNLAHSDRRDPRFAEAAGAAFEARRDTHDTLVTEMIRGAQMPDGLTMMPFEDSGAVFDVSDARKPAMSAEQIAALGLPTPPEGMRAVAIVGNGSGKITDAELVGWDKDGRFSRLILQDHAVTTKTMKLNPAWVSPGYSFPAKSRLEIETRPTPGDFMRLTQNQSVMAHLDGSFVIRPELNKNERKVLNGSDHKRRSRVAKRLSAGALSLGLAAGAMSLLPSGEEEAPRTPGVEYTALGNIDPAARARFDTALEQYRRGDVAALRQTVEASAFGREQIDPVVIDEVNSAGSIAEIEMIMDTALMHYDIDVRVPVTDTEDFRALDPSQLETARAGALGLVDFASQYGVMFEGEAFDFELVDAVYGDTKDDYAYGHYSHAYGGEQAVIRLSVGHIAEKEGIAQTRQVVAEVGAHEQTHHESLSDSERSIDLSSVSSANAPGAYYSEAEGGSTIKVGNEAFTQYATTDTREDVAETFEMLFEGQMPDMADDQPLTILENKAAALMADLEEEHPGISAMLLLNQKPYAGSPEKSRTEKVLGSIDRVRDRVRSAAGVAVFSAILLAGAAIAENRKARYQERAR